MGVMKIGEGCTFHSFTTNVYKFHFLESSSGIKAAPTHPPAPLPISRQLALRSFTLFELQSSMTPAPLLQIVLNTSPDVGDLREVMATIYSSIYVEHVVKNPLYQLGEPFK